MNTIGELKDLKNLPVVIVEQNGTILFINGCFEETYNWKASDLVGRTLTLLIPEVLRDAHNLGFSRFLVTEKSHILEQPLKLGVLTGDGQEIVAEHFISAERHETGWVLGATIKPLSEKDSTGKVI